MKFINWERKGNFNVSLSSKVRNKSLKRMSQWASYTEFLNGFITFVLRLPFYYNIVSTYTCIFHYFVLYLSNFELFTR